MSTSMDDLIAQISETHELRVAAMKFHQEALDTAQHDVQRLARVLALLQTEDEPCHQSSSETPFAVTIEGEQEGKLANIIAEETSPTPPLAVPHTIDVGALARLLPRTNPFADRPDSLSWTLWEIMKAGDQWHVTKDLRPALSAMGVSYSEPSIYNVFRREPTVFEGIGGTYHVTSAYAVPPEEMP